MKNFTATDINNTLGYPSLIQALRAGFSRNDFIIPARWHLNYDNPADQNENTMLLMPAIAKGRITGVKLINIAPANGQRALPSIHGLYYVADATTGEPLATMDAKTLTNWRTAATSALAADYLAREDSSTLLMIGTGSLAPFLIDAHASNRPINHLLIYGRNSDKASLLAESKSIGFDKVEVVTDLEASVQQADIISTATLSKEPLVKGVWLQPGQHVDLVGSYRPDLREADDEVLLRSRVYADQVEQATKESGDLAIPLETGVITMDDLAGDLFQLTKGEVNGRQDKNEITVFKSVGHALEDLVAAELILDSN